MELPICVTCGVQYGGPREDCPICEDERQYVGWDGQKWTTLEELRAGHRGRVAEEGPDVVGIGTEPSTAIGQRALLLRAPSGNVLWDMVTHIDDQLIREVDDLGGITAIAISHPHYYGTMIEWAHAFDAPVYIHEADRRWVARPDDAVVFWEGDTLELADGLTLINAGVHFDGGQVLHWRDARALFSGDILQVVNDRDWVSFMYSYPNYIPLAATAVRRIADAIAPLAFDRIYGAWWGRNIAAGAKAAFEASVARYLAALA